MTTSSDLAYLKSVEPVRLLYVAGPMTKGDPYENVRYACDTAMVLLDAGWTPIVPQLSVLWAMISGNPEPSDPTGPGYEGWMELDFRMLSRCDAVLRLPGDSSGADREVELARALGIPVFFSFDEAMDEIEGGFPSLKAA